MDSINNYFSELEQMMQSISRPDLEHILNLLENVYHGGHRIFIMGNGGSAATASHFALDLAKEHHHPWGAAPQSHLTDGSRAIDHRLEQRYRLLNISSRSNWLT